MPAAVTVTVPLAKPLFTKPVTTTVALSPTVIGSAFASIFKSARVTVILLEAFSPVTGFVAVTIYSPTGKLIFKLAKPSSEIVLF